MPRGIPNAKPVEVIEAISEPAKKIMPGLDEPIAVEDLEKYEMPARAMWLVMNPSSKRIVDEWWHTAVPAVKAAIKAWEGV